METIHEPKREASEETNQADKYHSFQISNNYRVLVTMLSALLERPLKSNVCLKRDD